MTTKQSLTLKLSAAQVIAQTPSGIFVTNDIVIDAAKSMSQEQKDLLIAIVGMSDAKIELSSRKRKQTTLALSLARLNMVETQHDFMNKVSVYTMNDLGWAVWHYIVNGTLPETEAAPVTETAESAPVIEDTPVDDLPAKMPLAPLMDADTNPPTEYKVGQTVRFHYFLSTCETDLYTGRIAGLKSSVRWGETALIVDIKGPNRFHVPPRYVNMDRIRGVVVAPATVLQEDAFTEADVKRLEKEWFAAQDAPRDFDQAMTDEFFNPSHAARTAYFVAYATYYNQPFMMPSQADIEMLKAFKNALPSSQEGVSSPSIASQVLQSSEPQEIAVERVLEGSRKTGVVASFNPVKGYGYIQTDTGETLYFQAQNLKVLGMPIKARDRVTFHVMPNFSIEGGMDKATRVMVEGYTPAPRPAYQPSADLVADAKTADMPRKQARRAQRTFEQDRAARNASGFARMPRKNA